MSDRTIAKNALLNTIKTILGIIFPIVTYPYVSRVLGVENIGIYNYSSSFLSYFILIAALGIATYGIRDGTKYRDDKQQITMFVSELFSINLISTVVSYVLLFVLLYTVPFLSIYRIAILILSVEIFFTTLSVSWVCNIYEDFVVIAIRTIAMQLVALILIFIFVRSENDLYKYVTVLLVSNSGANIFNYFYIRNHYCRFRFTFRIDWKRHLKPILIIFSTTIAITIYVSSDMLMLGAILDNYQVGLYGTAVKIYTIIKNILAAILMVMIPQFSLYFSSGQKEQSNNLFSRVFGILTVIMLPMCVGLFCLSEDIVYLASGKEYLKASQPLQYLSLAVVFSLYSYMYTQCVLIPMKKEKIVFRATLISAVVNIGLNFVLIPLWGITAAAITTIIAEAITFIISLYYSKGLVKLIDIKRTIVSTVLGCLGVLAFCLFTRGINNFLVRISCSFLGSIIIYVVVLMLTKNPALKQLKKIVRRKT